MLRSLRENNLGKLAQETQITHRRLKDSGHIFRFVVSTFTC